MAAVGIGAVVGATGGMKARVVVVVVIVVIVVVTVAGTEAPTPGQPTAHSPQDFFVLHQGTVFLTVVHSVYVFFSKVNGNWQLSPATVLQMTPDPSPASNGDDKK